MFLNFKINVPNSWIFYYFLKSWMFCYLRFCEVMGIYSEIFWIIFNSHDGTCITKYQSKDTAIGIYSHVHMINIEIVYVEFRRFFSWISKYFVQLWYWKNNVYIIKQQERTIMQQGYIMKHFVTFTEYFHNILVFSRFRNITN